jgi:hypothetical protein
MNLTVRQGRLDLCSQDGADRQVEDGRLLGRGGIRSLGGVGTEEQFSLAKDELNCRLEGQPDYQAEGLQGRKTDDEAG